MAIIVGDIHGNVDKVKAFLDHKSGALHIALGDYLDSFSVPQLQQIEALQLLLGSDAVLLWGNHDLHYLKVPPWICTGFQTSSEKLLQELIESNKHRFLAAYAVDGWLCTHAGVARKFSQDETDIDVLAARFNAEMANWLANPQKTLDGIFAIGKGRGGETLAGGIFWYDFKREDRFIAPGIKQIIGHTETKEPVVTDSYVALDTTNCDDTCYLFDTETNAVVELKLQKTSDVKHQTEEKPRHWPRFRDLPEDEQAPFRVWLEGQTRPGSSADEDLFYPWDYDRWKAQRR